MRSYLRCLLCGVCTAVVIAICGCGDKITPPADLPKPDYTTGGIDTSYLQINPVWTSAGGINFNAPYGVYVGYDQFIYVCDSRNNRVVKLDINGNMLESDSVVNPVAIAQDRGLDLLVVSGDFAVYNRRDSIRVDTIPYGNAVYRKKYLGDGEFKPVFRDEAGYEVQTLNGPIRVPTEYWGIAASTDIDKDYFVADFGNWRILRFGPDDKPIPPAFIKDGLGIGLTQYPVGLFTFDIVGQKLLAYAQGAGNLGVQIVSAINGTPLFRDTTVALPDLVRLSARGFKSVVVDEFSNYYVLLQAPDPLLGTHSYFYKYDRYGSQMLAFGTLGSGERQFRNPRGMAYKNGVIYIADTGNNRIIRYQLATDVQH